jgi:hypothetical protein
MHYQRIAWGTRSAKQLEPNEFISWRAIYTKRIQHSFKNIIRGGLQFGQNNVKDRWHLLNRLTRKVVELCNLFILKLIDNQHKIHMPQNIYIQPFALFDEPSPMAKVRRRRKIRQQMGYDLFFHNLW